MAVNGMTAFPGSPEGLDAKSPNHGSMGFGKHESAENLHCLLRWPDCLLSNFR